MVKLMERNRSYWPQHQDLSKLQEFQDFVAGQSKGGMRFSLVPKDLVSSRTTITTLLKTNYQDYNLEVLPAALFRRNLELDGELIVTRSRTFGARDKTLKGQSKDGWRHVELEADEIFMKILEGFTENHRFKLGSDGIQLWGGRRKQDPRGSNSNNNNNNNNNNNRNRTQAGASGAGNVSKNSLTRGGTRNGKKDDAQQQGRGGPDSSQKPHQTSTGHGARPRTGAP